MYVGHFAIGISIKSVSPRTPTLSIMLGVGFMDIVDGLLIIAGIDRVTPNLSSGPYLFFDLTFIDWDHSFLMAIVLSLVWAALLMPGRWSSLPFARSVASSTSAPRTAPATSGRPQTTLRARSPSTRTTPSRISPGPSCFSPRGGSTSRSTRRSTPSVKPVRCAIYTRVSTDQGLDQQFNSLDARYDASSAYIKSQVHAGWTLIKARYDDGGYSGGSTDRPDLQRLLDDVRAGKIDVIVVYKVDRLTRSLADFAKLVELFEAHGVSFVSVTQQFNTTTSMGRLTLNVLL